ncbi:hypothetical protein Sjap_000769 [Stephania japonica]|uniref:DYW domain-containing protein n=1 Tax=Stephania japonica TaxID=461633 RepID=A0AAP0KKI3_9MAGN
MEIISAIPTSALNLNNLESVPMIKNSQRRRISSSSSTNTTTTRLPFRKPHQSNHTQLSENNNGHLLLLNTAALLHCIDLTDPNECSETYALIFKYCRRFGVAELGFQVHARLTVTGIELCAFLGSQVLEFYSKFGFINNARQLFDKMSERNVFSWTSIIGLYCGLGDYEETIRLFYCMVDEGVRPDHFVFPKVFKACSELRNRKVGKEVYEYMMSIGFEGNPFVKKSVLDMFIKCGMMDFARKLFEEMEFKDVVVWNMMISGYASNGDFEQALKCFEDMKLAGVMPDCVTWNSIIAGYARKGQLQNAFNCFDEMKGLDDFTPNVVSWTALIAGNEQHGHSSLALQVFRQMLVERVKPNSFTIASVISACTNLSLLQHGKEIHAYCIKTKGLDSDVLVGNALVDFYAKCRTVDVARRKFNLIKEKDLISWNSMLAGYAMGGYREEAILLLNEMKSLEFVPDIITWNGLITGFTKRGDGNTGLQFFFRMCQTGIKPNVTSISSALAACASGKDLKLGKQIHGYVTRNNIELSTGVGSALISMYSDCGRLDLACSVFSELSFRDVVIWNSIISACAHNGLGVTALNLLREMVKSKVEPNMVTIVSILPACARLAALQQGKEIHQFIIRNGLDAFNLVWNALIDLYGRCGLVKKARRIFDLMPLRDIVSWNTMIAGYGMHGFGMDAVNLFRRLQCTDLKPNHFTFTSLLSACSHAGLTDEGWKYFKMMKSEYDLDPAIEQYACLVDLLARAGHFEESMEFIKEMPFQPNAAIWGSILGACRIHLNPELAEQAASFLFELEPQNSGNYILLANIYSTVGRWEDAAKVRCLMKERGVSKPPGCSWIAVKRRIHSFIVGDTSHPLMEEISAKVESLYSEIKEIGYVPETSFVLQDVEEDEKENSLCGHSEKLAIAFGLISTPSGTPLRIIKNLRVCGDCHSATKFISKVTNREIIMRDCFRFHHFVDGVCSCGDYW